MSKPYSRRPIHRRDTQVAGKSRDRIYLKCPNDRCDELDKWKKENTKTQWDWIIRRGVRLSDTPPIGLCDASRRIKFWQDSEYCLKSQVRPDGPTHTFKRVVLMVGTMSREFVFSSWKICFRTGWSDAWNWTIGLKRRNNDVSISAEEEDSSSAPDDSTPR